MLTQDHTIRMRNNRQKNKKPKSASDGNLSQVGRQTRKYMDEQMLKVDVRHGKYKPNMVNKDKKW